VTLVLLVILAWPAMAQDLIPVANEGAINDKWGIAAGTSLAMPRYPAEYAEAPRATCLSIGYLVNADGTTSDFALLNTWVDGKRRPDKYWESFANAAVQAMSQWRYLPLPAVKSPEPVYTAATFVFSAPDPVATRERCQIANLPRHLRDMQIDQRTARMMQRVKIFSRLDIDPTYETRLGMSRQPRGVRPRIDRTSGVQGVTREPKPSRT